MELKEKEKKKKNYTSRYPTRLRVSSLSTRFRWYFSERKYKEDEGKKKKKEGKDATSRECIFSYETDRRGKWAYGEIEKNRKTCISGEIARIARFLFLPRSTWQFSFGLRFTLISTRCNKVEPQKRTIKTGGKTYRDGNTRAKNFFFFFNEKLISKSLTIVSFFFSLFLSELSSKLKF